MRKGTDIPEVYFAGKCTAEEETAINLWYKTLDQNWTPPALSPEQTSALEQKLWDLIRKKINERDEEFGT